MRNFLSFQKLYKFLKFIHWLWRYNVWHKKPLLSLKKTLNGRAYFLIVLNNYPKYQSLQGNSFPVFLCFSFKSK